MTSVQQVMGALAAVRDPELDEPVTDLGFVAGLGIDGRNVEVRMRLPTYFCAPNFAWLMVAEARSAVLALDDVQQVSVKLEDHFAAEQINGAATFESGFPGETDGGLAELHHLFVRKAFVARQARLCDVLLRKGWTLGHLAAWTLSHLEPGPELTRCVELRTQLGIDASPDAPAFVLPDGRIPDGSELGRWLRVARLVRLSVEGNASICRGLLRTRYGLRGPELMVARERRGLTTTAS